MTNEKQNDISTRLDALEYLPGETAFDKDAAWENLHTRLDKKPRRNKISWYGAAACLLPLLLLLWMLTGKKENTIVTKKLLQANTTAPINPSPLVEKAMTIVAPPAFNKKIQAVQKNNKIVTHALLDRNSQAIINNPLLASNNTATEPKPAELISIAPPADTAAALAPPVFVKKKLRVVHINEMETTPAVSPQLAVSAAHEQYNVKLRLGNSHSINTPAADRQEYAGIIKIPLTN